MAVLFASFVAFVTFEFAAASNFSPSLPPQSVFIDPRSFTVIGKNGTFRSSTFETTFNPTSTAPPFFQIFDKGFLKVLGSSPSFSEIASTPGFNFAHEAPIYVPETDELFFASKDGHIGEGGNNRVSKISMAEVEAALKKNSTGAFNVTVTPLELSDTIQMTNGGTGPFRSQLLLANSGRGPLPPSIALVNYKPPYNSTILLDNFFGRQFNSLNDVKVHPSGKIFFTDVNYGFLGGFRPTSLMPNQVYRFDPNTGVVRVVADGFDKCNGLAFSRDGKTAFISDSGAIGGDATQMQPTTLYAFDVDSTTHAFKNRRVFAYVDAGIPDGIQLDTNGNVYSGAGDGVHTWDSEGTLLGKFFLGSTAPNMVFAGKGRLVILAETKIYMAKIATKGFDLGGR
ncbi:hypothetical protein PLEOSDRAFT_169186 [Pleurotus ostreatus PC15]|uniref:SMP-30/Gluconolactonase/LRE-like region domain-containing protein n=1 Tax=Pleurotus ostreatus (strain PC15) TaxID=1137138 RepID=A0A067NEX0_PLEO1|nr:hypothetical protein PLEOSDRAFT_169186 [Pleurotus ostreatus PC15]